MYFIEVIPAINIPREHPQILSYFSDEPLKRGAIVSIPVRNRPVSAIVLSSGDISAQKTDIKKSSFSLKKINKIICEYPVFSTKDFEFLKWFADYYFLPLGLALKTILPEKILSAKKPIKELRGFNNSSGTSNEQSTQTLCLLDKNSRFDLYIAEIKQAIQSDKQSLVIFPDYINAEFFKNLIDDYFPEKQISFFHSALTPKKYFDEWLKIANGESQIAIGARSAVFLKFKDLGFIVIDEEQDQNLKSWDAKPYYNARECALKLADIHGAIIILSSQTPSVETYHKIESRIKNQESSFKLVALPGHQRSEQVSGSKFQASSPAIVDMRDEIRKDNEIISEDLAAELEKIAENNGQALLFINRRGSATFIFCQECGFTVKCENCDAPMVFHKEIKNAKQQLVCHYCNSLKRAPDMCPKCGGLKIKYAGIASQKAEEIIQNIVSNLKIKRIDSETIASSKDLEEALLDFKNKKIDILIGTQMMLNKIQLSADLVAILSVDTILNLPEFRANEKIYQIINQVKNFRKNEQTPFILQTFKPDQEIFSRSLKSDFESLYADEIDARKAFSYPPFCQLIKITHKNPNPLFALSESQKITDKINELSGGSKNFATLGPAAGFIPRIKNQYIYNIIIKSNLDIKERNKILSIIPTKYWSIDIDPVSLI